MYIIKYSNIILQLYLATVNININHKIPALSRLLTSLQFKTYQHIDNRYCLLNQLRIN